MATLIPAYGSCEPRMTSGERRVAQRLESFLDDDCLCWFDVAVDTKYPQPDFIVLHPRRGLLILEVTDWTLGSVQRIDALSVSLLTEGGVTELPNPLLQARQKAFGIKNLLECDRFLLAADGAAHGGRLLCAYGFGVVLAEITREQFESANLGLVLAPHLVICKDEMTTLTGPAALQERLWAMLSVDFDCVVSGAALERIRWHLFPEIRVSRHVAVPQVLDVQQEMLLRSLGAGHQVIHGVAGSGKTLLLGFRCRQLAQSMEKPILVLCYNEALAARLEQVMVDLGVASRVSVRHFHRWCADLLTQFHVPLPMWGSRYVEALVGTVIDRVNKCVIPGGQYGAVLVDEGHEFEAEWLRVITRMIDPLTNSLLVLYDAAQSLRGGLDAPAETGQLRVNYRNTHEILHGAEAFAAAQPPVAAQDARLPRVAAVAAGGRGPSPQLVHVGSLKEETDYIARQLSALHAQGMAWRQMAVLYRATFMGERIAASLAARGTPCEWLKDSRTKRFAPLHDSVKVMPLQSCKGLEFPVVVIAGLGQLPYKQDDIAAEARLLYVGMTRAMQRLLLTTSSDSVFVQSLTVYKIAA